MAEVEDPEVTAATVAMAIRRAVKNGTIVGRCDHCQVSLPPEDALEHWCIRCSPLLGPIDPIYFLPS